MFNATVCLSTQSETGPIDVDENIKVIVDVITIPPQTKFSRLFNIVDEFAYVLEGFVVLHLEDRPDEFYKKGDVGRVPLTRVHKISTQEEGATILVFRVLEKGQPERVKAE